MKNIISEIWGQGYIEQVRRKPMATVIEFYFTLKTVEHYDNSM